MLRALLCACLLAAAAPAATPAQPATPARPLVVRTGDRARDVPAVRRADGGTAIRADLLAAAIGAELVTDGGERYHLQAGARRIDFTVGGSFARSAEDTIPLGAAVYRVGTQLFVPLAFATEALPQLASGLIYDPVRAELRRFGSVTAAKVPYTPPAARPQPQRATNTTSMPADRTRPSGAARRRVVVVDAGHGGPDNGMSGPIGGGPRVYEKQITLAVARELRTALERRGIAVVMTRTTDTLIALSDRGRIANQAKGDLFMSVHVNAANPGWREPGGARGFETYFLAEAKTEDERRVEAMENEAIKFETSADVSRDDPLGFIMRDMAQNEHLRESARLAELVQRGLAGMHPGPNRGVKQAGFRVLVTAFMPAVLVEIGFGTNRAESAYMNDPAHQRELAETLATAAMSYLEQYERKVGSGT